MGDSGRPKQTPVPSSPKVPTGPHPSFSSSQRLPTFRGPRDLTLSRTVTSRGRKITAPKPNIPPKRDRSGTNPDSSKSSYPSISKEGSSKPPNFSQRGRANASRGRGRGKADLVQSESIFAEGLGDPLSVKKHSSTTQASDTGTVRARSRGGSSAQRSISNTHLSGFVKQREKQIEEEFKGTQSKFDLTKGKSFAAVQEEELDPLRPIVLPLSSYAPDRYLGPVSVTCSQRNQNPAVKSENLDTITADRNSFVDLCFSQPNEEKLFILQLPDKLPVYQNNSEATNKDGGDEKCEDSTEKQLSSCLSSFPEGYLGKIQVWKSGRSTLVIGDNVFEIEESQPIGFLQTVFSVQQEASKLIELGEVKAKLKSIPDVEGLMNLTL